MPVSLDCILCLVRQSLEAVRHATDDPALHEQVLRHALALAQERGFTDIPPVLAQEIQRMVRQVTGNDDPYAAEKQAANRQMLALADVLRERITTAARPMEMAVRLAIAGNSIDNALGASLSDEYIRSAIDKAIEQPLVGEVATLENAVESASSILYLADNCGEIVCDRLLIEEMRRRWPNVPITVVVRGTPVLNDATLADAESVGLTDIVPVIDNGNDAVGTVLEQCGPAFRAAFEASDLIISKGLANFETLIEYDQESLPQPVVFLFKSKCRFITQLTGTKLGDLVVRYQEGKTICQQAAIY